MSDPITMTAKVFDPEALTTVAELRQVVVGAADADAGAGAASGMTTATPVPPAGTVPPCWRSTSVQQLEAVPSSCSTCCCCRCCCCRTTGGGGSCTGGGWLCPWRLVCLGCSFRLTSALL